MKRLLLPLLLVCPPVFAINLDGNGTITALEQEAINIYMSYFGAAGIFVREYCVFDENGIAKNRGKCRAEMPRVPSFSGAANYTHNTRESEYARQFSATPGGHVEANPEIEIVYLNSFPDVWIACNDRRAFGCTYMSDWPDSVTIILTTYDKQLGNITLRHEIEYHAKRNIKH